MAAAGIVVALALTWFAALISTVQHSPGLGARARLLRLLSPGQVLWALALLVGVGLVVVAARAAGSPEPGAGARGDAPAVVKPLLIVFFVAACAVGAAAALGAIVELSYLGDSIDAAFNGFFQQLAAIPIAAATAWWALHARKATGRPSA
ncbi:MAG: hypothetical protein ACR2KC_03425 [Acidimicrobiales bacterium]